VPSANLCNGRANPSTTLRPMNNEVLLEQFLAGDRQAFCELVVRYQPSILGIARHYVNSASTAEDVAQDTWMAVLRGAEKFEGRSSFKTWLFQIAANRARRTGTREHRVISVDPVDTVAATRFNSGGMWNEPPEPFTDLLGSQLDNVDVLRRVRDAISALPDPQKSVVTLRDVQGLTTSEVADILDLSEANIRVLLHRARAKIRTSLEDFKGTEQ